MEHFIKGLANEKTQISAIPPQSYGDRFVQFISGNTKTREAAEQDRAEAAKSPGSIGQRTSASLEHKAAERGTAEKVMAQAEDQAERSRRRGASEDDVPTRELRSVRSPSAERGELGTTLPVLEEAVESSSTGGHSGRSLEPSLTNGDPYNADADSRGPSHGHPPPTPPKDSGTAASDERPPTPPKDTSYTSRHSGPPTPPKELRRLDRAKNLPHLPLTDASAPAQVT